MSKLAVQMRFSEGCNGEFFIDRSILGLVCRMDRMNDLYINGLENV